MRDLPYYKMWVKDFETNEAVRGMNLKEAGLFVFALNHAWVNDGLPQEPTEIGRVLKLAPRDLKECWPRVEKCFPVGADGRRRNPRQEHERSEAASKSEKASKAVRTRYENSTNVDTNVDESSYENSTNVDTNVDESKGIRSAFVPLPALARTDSDSVSGVVSSFSEIARAKPETKARAKPSTEELRGRLGEARLPWWDALWAIYPCRDGMKAGLETFERMVHTRELAVEIFKGAERYAAKSKADPTMKLKYLQGWLNDERWRDANQIPLQAVDKNVQRHEDTLSAMKFLSKFREVS